jgi:cell division initiation protein
MALTPVEIRHLSPGKGLLGYKRAQTDHLLVEIAESFEDVWRERADLADKVESLEADLVRFRELEALLERAAAEMKEQARREADLILSEAQAESRKVQREAVAENERLVGESRRLRTAMRMALDALEDGAPEDDGRHDWPGEGEQEAA